MKNHNNGRRFLLKSLGLGISTGALSLGGKSQDLNAANRDIDSIIQPFQDKPMKIIKVESVMFTDKVDVGGGSGGSGKTEFCWVRIHTDTGLIGTGETYPGVNGELGALKDLSKRFLLGKDPRDIDVIWQNI